MKKQNIIQIVSCLLILSIIGCKNKFDEKEYLTKILNNIEEVKSASYLLTQIGAMSFDTTNLITYKWYVKVFSNPADTAHGYSYGWFYPNDSAKMYYSYDGYAGIRIEDNIKTISIDSFNVYRFPVRIVRSFFQSTKTIIQYALTSNDSLLTEFHDFGDSLLFRLTIYSDKQVELLFSRPVYFSKLDALSNSNKFEIWINKTTGLPYKYKTTNPSSIYWEEYSDIQINKMDIKDFIPSRYFPTDYDISVVGQGKITPPEVNLVGKTAPDWILKDYNNESFALKDFKSKVLMIQFSGIGCPPCHASLPFLNQLVADYKYKGFELVRVECWSDNIDAIKRYIQVNDIKYRFLLSDREIEKNYNPVGSVPVIFILDNNKVIQKVIRGYAPETTDKEIKEAIDKLL